jgi:large subunit ribosomal protein L17
MRHGDKINNLGRKKAHRDALLSNLSTALITHKRIVTTLAKAKALRTYIEPLLTKTKKTESKEQITHMHRLVFSHLNDKQAVKELFTVVAPKIAGRPGGYTRIIKLGIRPGDASERAMIELVDFNEVYGTAATPAAAETGKRTRRGRGGKSGGANTNTAAPATTEAALVPAAGAANETVTDLVPEETTTTDTTTEPTTPDTTEESKPTV